MMSYCLIQFKIKKQQYAYAKAMPMHMAVSSHTDSG